MATYKSDIITTGQTAGSSNQPGTGKTPHELKAHVPLAGAVADNEVIQLLEIPVDCILGDTIIASDDLGTTGDLNLGFYPGEGSGVTIASATDAVDEDALAVAIDVNAAAVAPTNYRFSAKGIETINQKAWQLAGLSAKPAYTTFILALTASEATTAAGDVTASVSFQR